MFKRIEIAQQKKTGLYFIYTKRIAFDMDSKIGDKSTSKLICVNGLLLETYDVPGLFVKTLVFENGMVRSPVS